YISGTILVVQDKTLEVSKKSTKVTSVTIEEFHKLNRPKNVNLKIRGAAQQLSKDKAIQRRYIQIQQKIKQFDNDKEAIQGLEIRR
ncbi:hypothetical protein MBANPS3_009649, partial [Mucor bainieri]